MSERVEHVRKRQGHGGYGVGPGERGTPFFVLLVAIAAIILVRFCKALIRKNLSSFTV